MVKTEQITRGVGFFMLDELLPRAEYCMAVVQEIILKNLILRIEYKRSQKTIAVYEVPPLMLDDYLAVYSYIYVQIFGYHPRLHAGK